MARAVARRASDGQRHRCGVAGREGLDSERARVGGLLLLQTHTKRAEARGAARHDRVSHSSGHGYPVHGGGAGVPASEGDEGGKEVVREYHRHTAGAAQVLVGSGKVVVALPTREWTERRSLGTDMVASPHRRRAPWQAGTSTR
jgi:hypothetical protein